MMRRSDTRAVGVTVTPPRRHRRGFTLLETVIALGLSSVILITLVLWVASLMRTTTTAIELTSTARDARFAAARLEDDLLRASSCDVAGFGPVVASIAPDAVVFFADVVDSTGVAGADGLADQVSWDASAGALRRAVLPGTGTCPDTPQASGSTLTVTAGVAAVAGTPIFTVYTDGVESPFEESCLTRVRICRFDQLRVRATVVTTGTDPSPATLDATFTIPTGSSRI
jgi:type II secretory pathway component PulJ